MSQEKVDRYKQRKRGNAKSKEDRRERMLTIFEAVVCIALCIGVVVWIGFSVYHRVGSNADQEQKTTVMDATAIDDYFASLSEATAAEE